MIVQIGMVVQYTETGSGGTIFPAFVDQITSGVPTRLFYPKGGTPQWQDTPPGLIRDDTLATANSWAPISYMGTVTIQSGV